MTPTQTPTPAPAIFTLGLPEAAGALDPAQAVDASALLITRHIYEGLTAYAPGTTAVVPGLAETWEATGAITWTFHLRPGVTFSDGTPFTATAAARNVARWANRQPPGEYVFWKAMFGGFADERDATGAPLSQLADVQTPDAQTLVLVLRAPDATLPATLAMPSFAMVNPAAFAALPEPGRAPASGGTGPYVLAEWTANGLVRLTRNPRYWGPPAQPDMLIFKPIPDDTQRLMALKVGEIDGLARPAPAHLAAVRADPALRLDLDPALNLLYLGFNQARAPWDNLDCRLAVAYALDQARYAQEYFAGEATAAGTLLPPGVWGYHVPDGAPSFDQEKARSHWQTCRQVNPLQVTQPFTFYVPPAAARPYLPDDPLALGAAIQADLATVGISVTVVSGAWPAWLADVRAGRADLFLLGTVGVNGDPDRFLCTLFCGTEPAFKSDKEGRPLPPDAALAQLLQAAHAEPDPARRTALYAEAQDRLAAVVPALPLAYRQSAWAYRAGVQGNVPSPIEDLFFGLRAAP